MDFNLAAIIIRTQIIEEAIRAIIIEIYLRQAVTRVLSLLIKKPIIILVQLLIKILKNLYIQ